MPIDARIDDGDPIEVYTGELRRDPVDILVETVNGLSERGIGLAAGDLSVDRLAHAAHSAAQRGRRTSRASAISRRSPWVFDREVAK